MQILSQVLLCFLICIAAFSRQACLFFSFDRKHKLAVTLAGQVFYLHHLIHKDELHSEFHFISFRVRKMSFQCFSDQIIKKIVIHIIILKLIINHVAYMKLSINRWCQYYINGNIFIQFKSVLMFLF